MKFIVEQLAFSPKSEAGKRFLKELFNFGAWVEDAVIAEGEVFGEKGINEANLSFGYQDTPDKLEVENLRYTKGNNWIKNKKACVSHVGMHVTAAELSKWRSFMEDRYVSIAQEVTTKSHTNEFLVNNGRTYNYTIFSTRELIGTDIKFIVRIDA